MIVVETASILAQMDSDDFADETAIRSVSELNREARYLLEDGIGQVAVSGEISNLARPRSGHLYFSLKDEAAQIRCAFFRQRQRGQSGQLNDGEQVIVVGQVSLYEPRGDFQLIAHEVRPAGAGILAQRFEALKRKLAAEGLFDAERKQALPKFPGRIGVITSPSGAALRDILTVLARRYPRARVRIYPVQVQGAAAPADVASMLALASSRQDCDVLLLARGGGSIEDLWAFNEEVVARAIADCSIPVIAGVGHETDVTIADFVADLRAPTPSGAAELAVPDQFELAASVQALASGLTARLSARLERYQQRTDWAERQLRALSPVVLLNDRRQRLAHSRLSLQRSAERLFGQRRERLRALSERLNRCSPAAAVTARARRVADSAATLAATMRSVLADKRRRLSVAESTLRAVSPTATLARGYAIATRADGRILRRADDVALGDRLGLRLADGRLTADVTGIGDNDE